MRQLDYRWFVLALLVALWGCPENVRPQNTTEQIFVAQWGVIGATNAVADAKDVLNPEDYDRAKTAVLQASVALACAKAAADVPGAPVISTCPDVSDGSALGYLSLLNSLLLEAAKYYAAKGE